MYLRLFARNIKVYILIVFSKLYQAIRENNEGEVKKLKALVGAEMKKPEPVFEGSLPVIHQGMIPELSYGQNPEVPSFSSAASLVHNDHYGRHLLANREIDTGNSLIDCIKQLATILIFLG
jgi:hypothetical protein